MKDWAISLSSLLTGKALEVYSRMPIDQANKYSDLKSALLHRYNLTDEGFRFKLRNAKRDIGETFSQFSDRLLSYLNRWVELDGTSKTYDGLCDLLLREQIISICGRDLVLYISERKPGNVYKMTNLADRYVDAHRRMDSENPVRKFVSKPPMSSEPQQSRTEVKQSPMNRVDTRMQDTRNCYVCGGRGH